MDGTTKIGVAAVVFAGLAGAVVLQAKRDQKLGTATADKTAELPDVKLVDGDVDKLVISHTDKDKPVTVTLEKKGTDWRVTSPVDAPANQSNVKSAIDALKELKATDVIAQLPADAAQKADLQKTYELGADKGVHVVAFHGADKKLDETFGKNGSRGQIMMVEGKPGIYASTGYSSYLFTREVKNWRDTEIFKFDDATATSLLVAKKDGDLSFTKGDKGWAGTAKGKPIDRLDEDKIKSALTTLKSLSAEDFADAKSKSETGLDAPDATVTVGLKDNAGKYVLKIGKVAGGGSRYAVKEGNDTVYVVSSGAGDLATADASKFQKPLDAGAPKDAAADAKTASK